MINQTTLGECGTYSYSNAGYNLAAAVIEQVTEKPFALAMEELVFEPYGLKQTAHATRSEVMKGRAQGYCRIAGKTYNAGDIDASGVIGAGSIISNLHDLFQWAQMIRAGKVFPERIDQEMHSLKGGEYFYGWSVNVFKRENKPTIIQLYHGGDSAGFESQMTTFFGADVTVIVLSNHSIANCGFISVQLVQAAFGGQVPDPKPLESMGLEEVLFTKGLEMALQMRERLTKEQAYGLPGPPQLLRLIDMCLNTDRNAEAVLAAEFYHACFPEDEYSKALLGLALIRNGAKTEGRTILRELLESHPDFIEARWWLNQADRHAE